MRALVLVGLVVLGCGGAVLAAQPAPLAAGGISCPGASTVKRDELGRVTGCTWSCGKTVAFTYSDTGIEVGTSLCD